MVVHSNIITGIGSGHSEHTMGCPKRAVVVLLSFLGFLILFGFRTVFAMVMVYVIKDNDNDGVTLFTEVIKPLM